MTTATAMLAALPDTRDEDWRYTDLSALKSRPWSEVPAEVADIACAGREPVTERVSLGGSAGHARLIRHRLVLRPGEHGTLLLHETGGDAPSLALHTLEIELAANAALTLYRIQQPGTGTSVISRLDARLARDARFTCIGLYAGGPLVRNDLNVSLDGPGCHVELHGVLAPGPAEHLDVHTRLDHRAPHGTSRETFRCLVPAKARAVFNGKVVVHPDAQKTDSEQHVDSLLLDAGAEVNAKPELQIEADDVKCAHGATAGQLDEQALYYLRQRGVDAAAARNLLLFTFAHAVLQNIALEPARRLAERTLLERLPGADALQELL